MKYVSFQIPNKSMNKDAIVNDWLKANPKVKIIHVLQTQDNEFINISMFYEG